MSPRLTKTEARQAVTTGRMRWILAISCGLAVAAMILVGLTI